jgi:CDP-glucose 4,6-dehydratase
MSTMFNNIYKNKNVLVTGHTGFKGSWLVLWLNELGANVIGYALDPPAKPNHYELLKLNINSIIADIRDREKLNQTIIKYKPEIVFHLAAQPLVRYSYKEPLETFDVNFNGTLNLLEACRKFESIKSIVIITSDKAYENKELDLAFKETDPMGGYDPYSCSKGCVELLVNSYRNSFFNPSEYKTKHNKLMCSARAGNVIGGGDWASDRLITDIIRNIENNRELKVRNPNATRPWQHVLDALSGYLLLGQKLLEENTDFADGWNFGPTDNDSLSVKEVINSFHKNWSIFKYSLDLNTDLHEARFLRLDTSKAKNILGWNPVLNSKKAIELTVDWYKNYYLNNSINSYDDVIKYVDAAKSKKYIWIQ